MFAGKDFRGAAKDRAQNRSKLGSGTAGVTRAPPNRTRSARQRAPGGRRERSGRLRRRVFRRWRWVCRSRHLPATGCSSRKSERGPAATFASICRSESAKMRGFVEDLPVRAGLEVERIDSQEGKPAVQERDETTSFREGVRAGVRSLARRRPPPPASHYRHSTAFP